MIEGLMGTIEGSVNRVEGTLKMFHISVSRKNY